MKSPIRSLSAPIFRIGRSRTAALAQSPSSCSGDLPASGRNTNEGSPKDAREWRHTQDLKQQFPVKHNGTRVVATRRRQRAANRPRRATDGVPAHATGGTPSRHRETRDYGAFGVQVRRRMQEWTDARGRDSCAPAAPGVPLLCGAEPDFARAVRRPVAQERPAGRASIACAGARAHRSLELVVRLENRERARQDLALIRRAGPASRQERPERGFRFLPCARARGPGRLP